MNLNKTKIVKCKCVTTITMEIKIKLIEGKSVYSTNTMTKRIIMIQKTKIIINQVNRRIRDMGNYSKINNKQRKSL